MNMEPIRLWRVRDQVGALSWMTALPVVHKQAWGEFIESEWAALTRAEYDALVARTEKPLDHVMRTSCGHEWTVRHTACPRCFDALRAERKSLVMERNKAIGAARVCREDAEINATRAEKAERERDDARAALDAQIATVLAAHLDAPTHDDRRGEDGAWCEGGERG